MSIQTITLLSTTDEHGHIQKEKGFYPKNPIRMAGGAAYIAGIVLVLYI